MYVCIYVLHNFIYKYKNNCNKYYIFKPFIRILAHLF